MKSVADHLREMAPALRATVNAARRAVKAASPAAREVAYQSETPRSSRAMWKIARYVLGDSDVAGIGTFPTHALLYLYRGAELDDGSGLLLGSGETMRSIRLDAPRDATRAEVTRVLRSAFGLATSEMAARRD